MLLLPFQLQLLQVVYFFTLLYVLIIRYKKGSIVIPEGELKLNIPMQSDILTIYYFSCLTFFGTIPGEYQATGYARWFVLLEYLVGKILEIIVIAVGIGLLISKMNM